MAWYRVGGGGLPNSIKTDMNNVLNKKFSTATTYPVTDWAKEVNLLGALEEKTVSGSIVTFSDGADDVPLKSCEVALPASLDGYSSVDVVSTGKNLFGLTPYLATIQNTPSFSDCMFVKSGTYTFSFDKISDGETDATSWRYCITVYDTDGQLVTDWTLSAALPYRTTLFSYVNGTNTTNKSVSFNLQGDCYIFIRFWSGDTTANMNVISPMLELGNTATPYESYSGTTHTASLGRTIYGGTVDVVKGTGTDENGNDFTFSPVEINSLLGDNTMWSDGDMSVVYRSSGTVTPILPTLISKSITANGTYTASDDDVDGYSEVVVNVASPEPTVTPLNSPNAFLSQSGVSGTDVERTVRTETAPSDGKYVFASDSTCRTNTGSGDGFIDIQKNGVSVVKQYMAANTTTPISIPEIEVETGDEVSIVVGFDNAHTSCNFQLYTGIAFVTTATPSLLTAGVNSTNEVENELNEEEE